MDAYRTLKVSAGLHTFAPGQTIDLPSDEAAALLAAGAIEPLHRPQPQLAQDDPKPEPKKRARKEG